jgi:hypothetical protein
MRVSVSTNRRENQKKGCRLNAKVAAIPKPLSRSIVFINGGLERVHNAFKFEIDRKNCEN